jgi:DNA-binding response OmpR family regulator
MNEPELERRPNGVEILLVEDNEDIAFLVEMLLVQEGYAVRVGFDGSQGLALLRQRVPEAVVMDLEMPVIDGAEMASRMFVEDCGKENVPIVVMSAAPCLASAAARMGTPYFLAKPFAPDMLLGLLERAITERKLPCPPL